MEKRRGFFLRKDENFRNLKVKITPRAKKEMQRKGTHLREMTLLEALCFIVEMVKQERESEIRNGRFKEKTSSDANFMGRENEI